MNKIAEEPLMTPDDEIAEIDQSTQVVAGQEAFVVVTVGADQSR